MTTAAARPRLNSAAAIFEPRHQAQAKRDMTSQRSAAGLAAARTTGDDAFTTAAAKPRLNSAASDGPEARGGASTTTAAAKHKLNSAAAIFEPRHHAQAKLDIFSQTALHASRPLDRVQACTDEPKHAVQADYNSRPQGCQHSGRHCTSPLTETFNLIKFAQDQYASASTVHPGGEIGVDLNKPSAQAVPDRQVYSLDDTLSSALQELLLTEDRRDFAQVIQVGCNIKHLCSLHMP